MCYGVDFLSELIFLTLKKKQKKTKKKNTSGLGIREITWVKFCYIVVFCSFWCFTTVVKVVRQAIV